MFSPCRIAGIAVAAWCALAILSCGSSTAPNGAVGSVKVTPPADTIAVGTSATLHATVMSAGGQVISGQHVFWNTANASVATVSDAGVVTGVAHGTVRIAASAGGASGIATIRVLPPPVASLSISPPTATLTVGARTTLTAKAKDAKGHVLDGVTIAWSSNKPSVATVSPSGLVKAVSAGAAAITAKSGNASSTAAIVVSAPAPTGHHHKGQPGDS